MAGSHLADFILKESSDSKIFGTKRWRSSLANVKHLKDKIELVDCNLMDGSAVIQTIERIKPDIVFHLAAQSYVPESWRSPAATLTDNMMMQLNLLEAIRFSGLEPVIQLACSSEEYGMVKEHELPINESNELRPLSPYGVSKVTQDMMGYQYWASYGMKIIRTRTFNHEGPRRGEVFVTSNFAKQIAEIELGLRDPVLKVGNLSAKRDWTDVRDIVRAYWLAVHHCNPGEAYVLASGQSRSIQELVDFLLSLSTKNIQIELDPERLRPSDVPLLEGDSSKFRACTGWQPEYTFEQMIEDLLNYWRDRLRSTTADLRK